MTTTRTMSKIRRSLAAATLLATGLGTFATPASAEGPCGIPLYSGDASRIGNLVFLDTDDDGIFEPAAGETGLSSVNVQLWSDVDDDGVFEPGGDDSTGLACTTTTDANGNYWFHDVASGTYFVAVTGGIPANHVSSTGSTPGATTDHTDDGAPISTYPSVTGAITINEVDNQPLGETTPGGTAGADETAADAATSVFGDANSNLTIDLGFAPSPATAPCLGLGNRVWMDLDNDGVADAGEPGINGVTVQLFASDGAGDPTGSALQTETTVDGGYYLFSCVDPGTYVVVIPASNFATGGALFGLYSSVDNKTGDQGDDGNNPANSGDAVVSDAITLTDNGAPTGEADKPVGGTHNFDDPADNDVDTEIDFGFSGLTIGNRIFEDSVTANGIQDAGEPGIAGVTVELWTADANGPTGASAIATTTTDANGYYLFKGVAAGDYVVRIPASNFAAGGELEDLISTPGNGTAPDADVNAADGDDNGDGSANGPVDSLPVTLSAGSEPTGETDLASAMDSFPSDDNANVTVDFGFVETDLTNPGTASIGDKVWNDADRNGVQDAGEQPVANVTVRLKDANGNTLATRVTDANGMYLFDGLPPGTYQVCFDLGTLPAGMMPTGQNTGGDDALDSDADATGCTDPVVLSVGEEHTTIDLGIHAADVDLSIDKTGTYSSGNVTWGLTVRNNGPHDEPGDVLVIDNLPTDVNFVSASGTGFSCSYSTDSHSVSCTYAGGLANGATANVSIVTKMKSTTDCTVSNTASVRGSGVDSRASNNADSASLTNACAQGNNQTQNRTNTNLPVTGATSVAVAVAALILGAVGWKMLGLSGRLRGARLRSRLGE